MPNYDFMSYSILWFLKNKWTFEPFCNLDGLNSSDFKVVFLKSVNDKVASLWFMPYDKILQFENDWTYDKENIKFELF